MHILLFSILHSLFFFFGIVVELTYYYICYCGYFCGADMTYSMQEKIVAIYTGAYTVYICPFWQYSSESASHLASMHSNDM